MVPSDSLAAPLAHHAESDGPGWAPLLESDLSTARRSEEGSSRSRAGSQPLKGERTLFFQESAVLQRRPAQDEPIVRRPAAYWPWPSAEREQRHATPGARR